MEVPTPTLDDTALETLEAQITEVWGHLNAATYRFLELIGEFDRTRGWARHGLVNCAQWLNWQCGIGACAAREKVRVARALEGLPQVSEAFRQGRLSYSKVRAVTRVATAENEGTLLNIALHGTASHVEKTVRKFRRVQRETERREADALHRSRYVEWWYEEDGSWRLQARLAPEVAAVVKQAIEAAMAAGDEVGGMRPRTGAHGAATHGAAADETATHEAGAHEVAAREAEEDDVAGDETAAHETAAHETAAREAAAHEAGAHEAAIAGDDISAETNGNRQANGHENSNENGHAVANSIAKINGVDHAITDISAETNGTGRAVVDVSAETLAEAAAEPPTAAPTDERPICVRRADGLQHMAEQYLAHRAEVSGSAAERYQVVVHINREDLHEGDEMVRGAELEQGRELAVATARRLGCDGSLVGLVEDAEGEPLNVGRKTRAIPAAIRRALQSRDGGCRFPGCDRSKFTHAHHIRHWADGGETRLSNLVTLCSYHHHLVHEGGYGVRVVDGVIEFTSPGGQPIPASGWSQRWDAHLGRPRGEHRDERRDEGRGERRDEHRDEGRDEHRDEQRFRGNIHIEPGELPLAPLNERRGVQIDAHTARCGWQGERMDYGMAVEALCWESGMRM